MYQYFYFKPLKIWLTLARRHRGFTTDYIVHKADDDVKTSCGQGRINSRNPLEALSFTFACVLLSSKFRTVIDKFLRREVGRIVTLLRGILESRATAMNPQRSMPGAIVQGVSRPGGSSQIPMNSQSQGQQVTKTVINIA